MNVHTAPYRVIRYEKSLSGQWDSFVATAKNATFLFKRQFMEYHEERFPDYSLLVYRDEKLVAVLPAHEEGEGVFSHYGLTYGGLVLPKKIKLKEVTLIFHKILAFLEANRKEVLRLKLLPSMYHLLPSGEIQYLLQLLAAARTRVEVATAIDLRIPLKIQSNRMEGVKKGQHNGLVLEEGRNFRPFWEEILVPNLAQRHDAKPVHSLAEIELLAERFPKEILQFNVWHDGKIVGGATIFSTQLVAHVQYISANKEKQQLGTLDFLFHYLITERFSTKRYFDFGTSNEQQGAKVNDGLQYWKECFGARSLVYEQYEVKTANHKNLNSVFI